MTRLLNDDHDILSRVEPGSMAKSEFASLQDPSRSISHQMGSKLPQNSGQRTSNIDL